MSGRVLLDTSVVIAIFAKEQPVLERVDAAEEVLVPAVALGELYYHAVPLLKRHYGRECSLAVYRQHRRSVLRTFKQGFFAVDSNW